MRGKLFFLLILIGCQIFAQNGHKLVSIGNLKTSGGSVITDCKIGYRTFGKINPDQSNVILWLTWYTGTSEGVSHVVPELLDTTLYYVILIDALGNGVSSSPSNHKNFPIITIGDMVNSQYLLLTKFLGINHIKAVMGISMGGMQTFEWTVAYPGFMDKAISIVGTPKQSFYDLLLWNTELGMIEKALKTKSMAELDFIKKSISNFDLLHLYTPAYFVLSEKPENLNAYLDKLYKSDKYELINSACQIRAMIQHDIYKTANQTEEKIGELIKAKLLVVAAKNDLMVNPQNAINLSKILNAELLTVDNDCGHNLLDCGNEKIRETIGLFLNK
jgi:homoserine O-acetyltransferase/O-succinyltransferase